MGILSTIRRWLGLAPKRVVAASFNVYVTVAPTAGTPTEIAGAIAKEIAKAHQAQHPS